MSVSSTRGAGRPSVAGRRPNYADGLVQSGAADDAPPEQSELFDLETDPVELLLEDPEHDDLPADLRSEPSRLSDEVGDVEPNADPRRYARALTREHT